MKASFIEQVNKMDENYRKEQESYCINKCNTFYEELNRKKLRTIDLVIVFHVVTDK